MQKITVSFKIWPVDIAALRVLEKTAGLNESEAIRFLLRSGLEANAKTPVKELRRNAIDLEAKAAARQWLENENGGLYALD
jgi:hypothetical protein